VTCVGQGRQLNEDGTEDTHRLEGSFTSTPMVLAGFLQLERPSEDRADRVLAELGRPVMESGTGRTGRTSESLVTPCDQRA